ncbi:hypothetical protein N0V82_007573 [Gnomoniopsis sp. IMI 355080]|nr:hypothetical protein N0V82_007573 [Gnomoniopsis sp. IMI 355080]
MASSQEQETRDAAATATASGQGPPPEEIAQAIEAAKTAASFQDAADALKKQASVVWDPAEREKLLRSAYAKEKAAHGESKKARVMASGWGQGAGFGVGISAAVGMGAGNLVGALLSGVVAVPGVLIGSGVGAIHGPFVKLKDSISGNGKKAQGGEGNADEKLSEEIADDTETETDDDVKAHAAIVEAARKLEDEKPADGEAGLKEAHDDAFQASTKSESSASGKSGAAAKHETEETTGDGAKAPPTDKVEQQPEREPVQSSSSNAIDGTEERTV